MGKESYLELRHKSVVKANELIQKSRFDLTVQQQKIILYLISQIKQTDEDFEEFEFNIIDFCKVCGIDYTSGKNYADLKNAIKEIADKSLWITLEERETLIRWIEKPYINKKDGTIRIRLDKDMKPFLLQLRSNFTKYELIFTLRFKSKYSIRLYELVKSIHYHEVEIYQKKYTLDELRQLLGAESYKTYQHFRDRALEPAVKEINAYSDKLVSYTPLYQGRKVIAIGLTVESKDSIDLIKTRDEIDSELGYDKNQLSLFDDFQEGRIKPPLSPFAEELRNAEIAVIGIDRLKEIYGEDY